MVQEIAHHRQLLSKPHVASLKRDFAIRDLERKQKKHISGQELNRLAVVVSQNDLCNWDVEGKHANKDVHNREDVEVILFPD